MEHPTVHALNWFEIPVRDLNRAQVFYETLLATRLRRETIGASQLAVFVCGEHEGATAGRHGLLCAHHRHRTQPRRPSRARMSALP